MEKRGARKTSRTLGWLLSISFGIILGGLPIERAEPAPTGGVVSAGEATIDQSQPDTTIITQTSTSLVIDWATFNVSTSESVIFNQPSNTAAVLNRINDTSASQILGTIQANGQVFLTNPHGIVFGKTARVNVGSLFASTLVISNEEFLSGNYNFKRQGDLAGAVINHGVISASSGGFVVLVGNRVENRGLIVAKMGHVQLSAAGAVTMDFHGDGLIQFQITDKVLSNPDGSDAAVLNTGTIKADGGKVVLSAKAASSIFTNVVNNTGVIHAGHVVKSGGVIHLLGEGGTVRSSGTLHADNGGTVLVRSDAMTVIDNGSVVTAIGPEGGQGGRVHVLGSTVALLGNAQIDVSGDTGGGEILIGGDFQGKGTVPNAQYAFVDDAVTLTADAKQAGDGGTIIVWSDIFTVFYGSLRATGGPESGDGGFAEVSGKQTLAFDPTKIDLSAAQGKTGTLLLDPYNITIQDAGPDSNIAFTGDDSETMTSSGDSAILTTGTINTTLASASVLVQTGADGAQAGDITITGTITAPANSGNLTIQAADDITMNAGSSIDFSSGGTANVTLTADSDSTGAGTIILSGSISMGSGTLLLQGASGALFFGTAAITSGGAITIDANKDNNTAGTFNTFSGASISTTNGAISITADDVSINSNSTIDSGASNTSLIPSTALTIGLGTGAGSFKITDAEMDVITAGTIVVGDASSGAITVGALTPANSNNLTLVTGSTINDSGAATTNITLSGTLTMTSSGAIGNLNGGLNTDVGTINVTATGGNNVTIADTGTADTTVSVLTGGAGNVVFTQDANDILVNVITTTGNVTLTATLAAIDDHASDTTTDITANNADLNSATGIGDTFSLELDVPTLTADTAGAGEIRLVNADADPVAVNSLTTGSGFITYQGTGTSVATVGTVTTTGAAALAVNDGITLNGVLTVGAGATVNADRDTDGVGTFTMNAISSISAGTSTVTVLGVDMTISAITTTNTVTLTATGSINDHAADATTDITAGSVNIDAVTGIGNTAALELNVPTIAADTTNGEIDLNNADTDAVTISSLTTGTGPITYTGSSSSTFTTVTSNNTAVSLTDKDGITLDGAVTTSGGTVTIDADSDAGDNTGTFTMDATGSISTTSGAVSITADDVALNAASSINSGTANTSFIPSTVLTIGLGTGAGDFSMTNTELLRVTADTLLVGDDSSGAITVTDVDLTANTVDLTLQSASTIAIVDALQAGLQLGADALLLGATGITVDRMTTVGASNLISTEGNITNSLGGATTNVTGGTIVIAAGGVTPHTVGTSAQNLNLSSTNTIKAFSGSPQLFISADATVTDTLAAYLDSIVPTYIPQNQLLFGTISTTTASSRLAATTLQLLQNQIVANLGCSIGASVAGGGSDNNKSKENAKTKVSRQTANIEFMLQSSGGGSACVGLPVVSR